MPELQSESNRLERALRSDGDIPNLPGGQIGTKEEVVKALSSLNDIHEITRSANALMIGHDNSSSLGSSTQVRCVADFSEAFDLSKNHGCWEQTPMDNLEYPDYVVRTLFYPSLVKRSAH